MSDNKNPLKGLSEDEIIILRLLAKIYVQSIIKQADEIEAVKLNEIERGGRKNILATYD